MWIPTKSWTFSVNYMLPSPLFSNSPTSKPCPSVPRPSVQFFFLNWHCCHRRPSLCACVDLVNTTQIMRSSNFVSRNCSLPHYFNYKILLYVYICIRVSQLTYQYVLAFLQSSKTYTFFSSLAAASLLVIHHFQCFVLINLQHGFIFLLLYSVN